MALIALSGCVVPEPETAEAAAPAAGIFVAPSVAGVPRATGGGGGWGGS